jgi:hypothetical protein
MFEAAYDDKRRNAAVLAAGVVRELIFGKSRGHAVRLERRKFAYLLARTPGR